MKMNLSVVMGIVDKVKAPLKGMASESDHYAKKIKKVQQRQADTSSAMGMIDAIKSAKKAMDRHTVSIAATNEKLAQMKIKAALAAKPSAELTEKIQKQQEKLDKLNAAQASYQENLTQLDGKLKKAGVNTKALDSEYERLNHTYTSHGNEITKLTTRYTRLQKAMTPFNKMGRMIQFPKIGAAALGKGTALLGGLSLAGLVSEVNGTAAAMDNLAKKSATIRMPINELQAMQSQAEHAGVDADVLTQSMVRFTKRLGVLQSTGSGALGSFLKSSKNGVYRDLKAASSSQDAYQKLLVAFSKLKTEQEQMAFADAAFGDDGRKMLIMLREGTDGLTAARKEFNALGGGVSAEDAAKAEAYNDAMQKVGEAISSIKFAALTPVMEKLTQVFTEFTDKFKNAKWRSALIAKVTKAVNALYNAFKLIGNVIVFVSQHFREIIAVVALLKVGMIALNAVMMANPLGLIVAAIAAAVVAITYLIDKFIGLDKVIKWIGDGIGWLWEQFKKLINKLPDAFIPDGWKIQTDEAGKAADQLGTKLDKIKDKNATLGITTHETLNQTQHTRERHAQGRMKAYSPLGQTNIKSKSEVALTIKSERPVTIDKAKSEKGTDLNLDVGDMTLSY